jgi:hypothetical protein
MGRRLKAMKHRAALGDHPRPSSVALPSVLKVIAVAGQRVSAASTQNGRKISAHHAAAVIGKMLRQHLYRVEPAVGADADNRRRHSKARWPRRSSARSTA